MLDRERVHEVFAEAVALAGAARAAFLDGACAGDAALRAEIESLLAAVEGGPTFMAAPTAVAPGAAESVGAQIGPYRLLQEIGEGGFGTVYMAEQTHPVRRSVAVKIIKLGMDTRAVIARFEAERQALAMMDHAHIARVLDAGATDSGRPYFVMELVRGDPITAYCDRNNLTIADRLQLFVQVCHAVQHAHSKGVIHRDIKPTNVLVATQDGRPHAKVIDFGIAKATQHRLTEKTLFTEFRQFMGTPEYMSPEQAEGSLDIDTRADVYGLGVLLYELLTGSTPFDAVALRSAAYAEIQRIIREVEPPKPSTRLSQSGTLQDVAAHRRTEPGRLSALVRGDLDWIAMKALDKDRSRRYDTPSALASDIARYVAGEPVGAVPPSAGYRLRKFVRRHRGLVAAGAAVAGVLLLGVAGTSIGMVRANRALTGEAQQREKAQESTRIANAEAARAAAAEAEANTQRERAEYDAYIANIASAYGAVRMNDLRLARKRLDACPPERRNWEWRCIDAASDESILTIDFPPVRAGELPPQACYSLDGARIVTGGRDGIARVYRAEDAVLLAELRGHTGAVTHVRFSPDGGRILTGSSDRTLRLWDARTYGEIAVLAGHQAGVASGSFTADGSRVVSKSQDTTARVWDGISGREVAVLSGHTDRITSAYPSPDGSRVLTTSLDQTARLWDAATGEQLVVFRGHTGLILTADFSPSGERIVTAAFDGTARVWEAATGREIAQFRHGGNVTCAKFSPDGTKVLSSAGTMPRIWDAATGQEQLSLPGHTRHVRSAVFSPDGKRILTQSEDTTVRVWDAATGRQLWLMRGHVDTPQSAWFSPDGSRVLSSDGRSAHVWSEHPTGDDQIVPDPLVDSIAGGFSPDGRLIFEVGLLRVRVIDPRTGAITRLFDGSVQATSGSFSPDGTRFACGFEDNTVRVWDFAAGRSVLTLNGHESVVNDVEFSPDGRTILSASDDTTARLWDARSGETIRVLRGHEKGVLSVCFDEAGERIVTASEDMTVRIWDAGTGSTLQQLLGHRNIVRSASFSRDGARILSTADDYTARVWNASTGEEQSVLRGHEMILRGGGFLPDGSRVVTASLDGTARIWDPGAGREVLSLDVRPGRVHTAQFSRDGTRLLLFSTVGEARILDSVPFRERFARGDEAAEGH